MKRVVVVLTSLLISVLTVVGTLTSSASALTLAPEPTLINNLSSVAQNYTITSTLPYTDGPFDAAVATVGGTVADGNGDGASLSGTLDAMVNGSSIISIPLSASVGPYSVGAIVTPPDGGGGTASTQTSTVSAAGGSYLTQKVTFGLSGGGDMAAVLATATLSGGTSPSPFQLVTSAAIQDFGTPSDFSISISKLIPDGSAYSVLTVDLLCAFLDAGEDGASLTNLAVATSIGQTEVSFLDAGDYTTPPDFLGVNTAGQAFSQPTLGGVVTPSSGTMSIQLKFELSAFDSAALVSRFDLLNSPQSTPVPEPTTVLLLGSGLVGLAGYGRKRKR